jgi:hypothetical protein
VSLGDDRRQVKAASANLLAQRTKLLQRTAKARVWIDKHRATILVSGGFAAGLLIGRRQFANVAGSIASAATLGMSLIRSPLASILLASSLRPPARTDVKK